MRIALLLAVLPSCSLLDLLPAGTTPSTDPIEVGSIPARPTPGEAPAFGAVHRPDQDLAGAVALVVSAADGSHGVVIGDRVARSIGPDGALRGERRTGELLAATAGPAGTWALAEPGQVTLLDGAGAVTHTLPITAVDIAASPDGRYLAIATEDDIRIADTASGRKLATFLPEYGGGNLWWHPDGHTLFSSDAFSVYVWDVTRGGERGRFTDGLIEDLAVSPDGADIWTWNGSDRPTRWDALTLEKRGRLETGTAFDMVYGGAMHGGGEHLLIDTRIVPVGGGPGWPVGTSAEWADADLAPDQRGVWLGTERSLERWTFLPEGAVRAVGPRQTWEGGYTQGGRLDQLTFTPDGSGLVVVGRDGSITRWDVASGTQAWQLVRPCEESEGTPRGQRDCSIYGVGSHADIAWVGFLDEIVEVSLADGAVRSARPYAGALAGRLADGRYVGTDEGAWAGADPTRTRPVRIPPTEDLTAGGRQLLARLPGGGLQRFDARGAALGAPLEAQVGDGIASLTLSPVGTHFAESGGDGTFVRVSATGETLAATRGWNARFSPDGRWLASGLHAAGVVHLETGTTFDVQAPGPGVVAGVAFSPDGSTLAIAEGDDEAGDQLWVVDLSTVASAAGLSID